MEKNDGRKTICRRGYNFNRRNERIRKKLDLTQKGFVGLLGCSKKTVERWEKEPASGPVVLLMKLLERNMDYNKRTGNPFAKPAGQNVVPV